MQKKDRPELKKVGWEVKNLAKTFKLPPIDDKMVRVDGKTMSLKEFREKFEHPRLPCVITGLTDNWKARENWTVKNLSRKYANAFFKCGEGPGEKPVYLKFKYFAEYMRENEDDSPLYIFDPDFGTRKRSADMLNDYHVPRFFEDDLFELLGTHTKRPPYRWIVIGPARSGTNIHIDPLGTSAWNALIQGHKRWVFIHPDAPSELVHIPKGQRGIHPKEAVTWFSTVYKRIRDGDWPFDKYPVLECRQNPGETLFVPCGWWHVVINEDNTVAVTQNFCSPVNLIHVYPTILKERPGFTRIFLERLNEERPDLLPTVYDSLLHSEPILDGYLSDTTVELDPAEVESDSSVSVYSTDSSGLSSESEDRHCEEMGGGDRMDRAEEGKRRAIRVVADKGDEEAESYDEDDDEDDESEDSGVSSGDHSSSVDDSLALSSGSSEETSSNDEIFRRPVRSHSPIHKAPIALKRRAVAAKLGLPSHFGESEA